MIKGNRKWMRLAGSFLAGVMCVGMFGTSVQAEEVLVTDELSAGAGVYSGVVGSADVSLDAEVETEYALFMANVNDSMNVREEANEDSKAVGKLFKNCGGEILEQSNGWTKIRSGKLEGWAKDEYLLFGEGAEALRETAGSLQATVLTDALRVRKEASEDAGVYGLVKTGEEIKVVEQMDGWVAVQYDKETVGYVSVEYVEVEYKVPAGKTTKEIQDDLEEGLKDKKKEH